MLSADAESILSGRPSGRARRSIALGGGVLIVVAVAVFGLNLLFEALFEPWPVRNSFSPRVVVGTTEVPAADIWSWLFRGLIGVSALGSLSAAFRNRGLLSSLALSLAPVVGFQTGEIAYYATWDPSSSLGGVLGALGFGAAVGFAAGVLGFLLGVGLRVALSPSVDR